MPRRAWWRLPLLMWGVLGIALLLRAPVTSVAPALAELSEELAMSAVEAGATTALPLVCFGIFAFATPFLVARWGLERTTLAALTPILVGVLLRGAGGTSIFFAGALLIGVGIAIGNVLVPAIIRTRFPTSTAYYMGLYTGMLQISAASGSALTAPFDLGLGWGWRAALAVWALPATASLVFWVVLCLRPVTASTTTSPPSGMAHVAARRRAWAITVFMGFQSAVFYGLVTWLPAQLIAIGLTPAQAGATVGAFSLLGLPAALLAPRVATSRHAALSVWSFAAAIAAGLMLLTLGPLPAVVGTLVAGAAQGGMFSIALTYIADQPDHRDVPALSALAQGVGYVLAGLGPIGLGALHESTGGWFVPDVAAAVVMIGLAALGSVIGPRLHADHLARRT